MKKVGDVVIIDQDSEYYQGNNIGNPKDTIGEIVEDDGTGDGNFNLKVEWSNGHSNIYNSKDLRPCGDYGRDINGKVIVVGSTVAYNPPYYKGLAVGTVLSLSKKSVRIESVDKLGYWNGDICTRPLTDVSICQLPE